MEKDVPMFSIIPPEYTFRTEKANMSNMRNTTKFSHTSVLGHVKPCKRINPRIANGHSGHSQFGFVAKFFLHTSQNKILMDFSFMYVYCI